jgi:hypothetical protein
VTTRRLITLAVAGILALAAGATGFILWTTSGPAEASLESDPALPLGRPGATGAPVPPTAAPQLSPEMALRVPSSALLPPERREWEQIRPLTKPIAPLVRALAPPVAPCFGEDSQARFGPTPHTTLSDATGDAPGQATLMLQLEAVDGGLRVVDAPVASLGPGADGLVACAQQALRGRMVSLPQLQYQAGDRITMSYPLVPPAGAVPAAAPARPGAAAPPPSQPFRRQRGKGPQPPGP